MTKSVEPLKRWLRVAMLAGFIFLLIAPGYVLSAQLRLARLTQVINDVTLLPLQKAPKPAQVNDEVSRGTAVRTGARSRSELIFTDQTLVRLGASTIYSFREGTRIMDLGGGAVLLQMPRGGPGAKITTGVMTSAVTGTVMLKYDPNSHLRFIVLEGTARLDPEGAANRSIQVRAGECSVTQLMPQLARLSDVFDIDLKRLMATSLLIKRFPPLDSEYLIMREVQRQSKERSSGQLSSVGMLVGATDVVDQAATAQAAGRFQPDVNPPPVVLPPVIFPTPTVTPTPTPIPPPSPTPSAKRSSIRIARGGPSEAVNNTINSGRLRSPVSGAAPGPGGRAPIPAKDTGSVVHIKGTVQPVRSIIDVLPGPRP
jgi:hypothetical protein